MLTTYFLIFLLKIHMRCVSARLPPLASHWPGAAAPSGAQSRGGRVAREREAGAANNSISPAHMGLAAILTTIAMCGLIGL